MFWILAPLMVLAALGVVLSRKAVHSALCLAFVMISLAILYAVQHAPFLFAVQIIVYTGAIMMLFLFVLMLVGVDSSDALTETIKGHRIPSIIVGVLFGAVLAIAVGQTVSASVVGLKAANTNGNVHGLAELLFTRYVLAFEFTAALMIVAVLGAMVLAHREVLKAPATQAEIADQRMREYAETGRHPGNAPTPGVYALHNAVDTPALLPDGSPLRASVSEALQSRGQFDDSYDAQQVEDVTEQIAEADLPEDGPADDERSAT